MTGRDFCFWLQGYFELSEKMHGIITAEQVEMIKQHLALVFTHEIDPSMGKASHQANLDAIHKPFFQSATQIADEIQTPSGPIRYRC